MPPLLAFDQVQILPYTQLLEAWKPGGAAHCGGPLWPDWERQVAARHCRARRPVDIPPAELPPEDRLADPVAWGGAVVRHFGHQIADFSMRILPTLGEWPDAGFAFAVKPQTGIVSFETTPPFFAALLEWFGVPRQRVQIVSRPTVAARLLVAPQAEQFGTQGGEVGPTPDHLDALDALVRIRLGTLRQRGTVYVSRAGQRWHFAGETAVEAALARAGVEVLRPEELPLTEQLRRYATAERLLFAEGSALHGLQLLGRGLGDVDVLLRREGSTMARASLVPRARSVAYHHCGIRLVHGLEPTGRIAKNAALSLLDEASLIDTFARLGIDIAAHWDAGRYRSACEQDARTWLGHACEAWRLSIPGAAEVIRTSLAACGFGHLTCEVDAAESRLADDARRTAAISDVRRG